MMSILEIIYRKNKGWVHSGLLYFITEVKLFISIVLALNMFQKKLKNLLGIKT